MPTRPTGPPLIHPVDLAFAELPEPLAGLRCLHVSDLHIRHRRRRYETLIESARQTDVDLLLITGDMMHLPGDEALAAELVGRLIEAANPRFGTVGSFGNHDTADLHRLLSDLPATWLCDETWASDRLPLRITGLHYDRVRRGDLVAAMLDEPADPPGFRGLRGFRGFRVLLAHMPVWLPAAAQLGFDLVLSGHTHGGQVRLPGKLALENNCDWPLRLSSGVMRRGRTTMVLSRGLGETVSERLRFNCPPHAPLITLRQGPAEPAAEPDRVEMIERW